MHQEAPIHVSNVQVIDPETKQAHPGRLPGAATDEPAKRCGSAAPAGNGTSDDNRHGDGQAPPQQRRAAARAATATEIAPGAARAVRLRRTSCRFPALTKIVVNMGVGEAARDAQADRRRGQRPVH